MDPMTRKNLLSKLWLPVAAVLVILAVILPAQGQTVDERAIAVLRAPDTGELMGYVWFTQKGDQLEVVGKIRGLNANQKHGFHIHQFGDTSADDGTSAGGHYNPGNDPHGAPTDPGSKHHAGDLGNITADANGMASFKNTVELSHQEKVVVFDRYLDGSTNPLDSFDALRTPGHSKR